MTDKEIISCVIEHYNMNVSTFARFIEVKAQRLYDILKGRNGISKDLKEKIQAKCVDINPEFLLTGKGNMLKDEGQGKEDKKANDKLDRFFEALERRDRQIDELIKQHNVFLNQHDDLISLLKKETKNLNAHREDDVGCADAK